MVDRLHAYLDKRIDEVRRARTMIKQALDYSEQAIGTYQIQERTTAQNACPYRSAFTKAVDEVISDAKPLPLTKAEVARRIHWQGKTGIAKSNLSGNGPWIASVQEFVQIGKVRS